MIKNCTLVFMLSTHYFFPVLKKLEFSQQIFEKYSTINFHENLFSGTRIVPCDQTDRHNEVTHFSQFCKRTIKSNWKLNSVISLSQSRSQSVGWILLGHEYFPDISALSRDSRGPSTDRSSIRALPLVLARISKIFFNCWRNAEQNQAVAKIYSMHNIF